MDTSNKLYILGHPVKHSKSPLMHNAVFKKLGLNWEYDFADCACTEAARTFLEQRAFRALNITTPYKPLALEVAAQCAPAARLARGANVLVVQSEQTGERSDESTGWEAGEQLVAYNVDGVGCVSYLKRAGVSFADAHVVICGTGPTSLAIMHAVASAGTREVLLVGRNEEHTREVLESYEHEKALLPDTTGADPVFLPERAFRYSRGATNCAALRFGSYETAARDIAAADIIIDATPLGMKADDPAPFDTALLSANQTVFDVVYGHGESALLAAARQLGCVALDGAGMLVAQAVISARIFFDAANINVGLSDSELFDIMESAAGFNL